MVLAFSRSEIKELSDDSLPAHGSHKVLVCRPWTVEEKLLPIFAREMIAFVETIRKRTSTSGFWVVAVDNATVVSTWRHRYSKSPFLRARLLEVKEQWDSVRIIQVRSEQNASDELSREKETDPQKVIRCRERLHDQMLVIGCKGPDAERLKEHVS
jgi:hypothetical protein